MDPKKISYAVYFVLNTQEEYNMDTPSFFHKSQKSLQ